MQRKASAVWNGGLKDGHGTISTETRVLDQVPYDFAKRFENTPGTNPEELIAAAHAACFSMALSGELAKAGMTAESIRTTATVTLERSDAGFSVTRSHLEVVARIPKAVSTSFESAVQAAKSGCPISRLLNTQITMDAKLEQAAAAR